ncbi:MAG: hypothetical protein JWR10_1188 [Rubritepida sp.]|nr:hypothetical protein [Rubritepida sp.]
MRGIGLLVAGRLRTDHPFVRWAASVSVATLATFIAAAVIAPTGTLASIPLHGRIAGLVVAVAVLAWRGGLLLPLLAGLAATLALSAL